MAEEKDHTVPQGDDHATGMAAHPDGTIPDSGEPPRAELESLREKLREGDAEIARLNAKVRDLEALARGFKAAALASRKETWD